MFIAFIIVAVIGGVIFLWRHKAKLPSFNSLGVAMPPYWKLGAGILAAVIAAGLVWWYWDTITDTSFGWRFIIAGFAVIVAWRLTKAKKLNWATSLLGLLVFLFFVNVLASNVGKVAAETVTSAEAGVDTGSFSFGSSCTGVNKVEKRAFTLKMGCSTLLDIPGLEEEDYGFLATDSRFYGLINKYVKIVRLTQPGPGNDQWEFTPKEGTFPGGADEMPIKVTSNQAQAADPATEAAGADILFGTYATK